MKLSDLRVIVTGAARGLGYSFALELAREGARVMAGDVNVAGLRRLRSEAASLPGSLTIAPLDISDEKSVGELVALAAATLGGVNALINNAAVLLDGLLVVDETGGVRKLPLQQWDKGLDVNLTGQFLMAREVAAQMIESGEREGVIVNISSLARSGNIGQSNYAASKSGLDACTRTWALELAPRGIRVAGVAPGVIDTPILEGISDEALDALKQAIPLRRIGRPEEVWQAVRFALECDFFTGRTLEVDGGASMG